MAHDPGDESGPGEGDVGRAPRARRRRWTPLALLALAAIAALLATGVPFPRGRAILERDLARALGHPVRIEGPVRIEFVPWLRLDVESLFVDPTDVPGGGGAIRVDALALELRLLPLLRGRAAVELLEVERAELRLALDDSGRWRLPGLPDPGDPAAFETDVELVIRELHVEDLEVVLEGDAESPERVFRLDRLHAETEDLSSPIRVEALAQLEGLPLRIDGELGSWSEWLRPDGDPEIGLVAEFAGVGLEAEGRLYGEQSSLRVIARLDDAGRFAREMDVDLGPVGALVMEGTIVGHDGGLALRELKIRTEDGSEVEIDLQGSIQNVHRVSGIRLDARLVKTDLEALERWVTVDLPSLPLNASVSIDDEDGSLGVEGDVAVRQGEGFSLLASGIFGDVFGLDDLDVKLELQSIDLERLSRPLGLELEGLSSVGPVEATGRLVIEENRLALRELDARVGDPDALWIRVVGSVGDVVELTGLSLSARVRTPRAQELASRLGREIPDVGPGELRLEISDADGSLGIESFTAHVGRPDDFDLTLKGAFDDLENLGEIQVEADLDARDLRVVGSLFDLDLPAIGPLHFEGQAIGSAEELETRGELGLAGATYEGELHGSLVPGSRPRLRARLRSPQVYFPGVLDPILAWRDDQATAAGRDVFDGAWWRQGEPLDLDVLSEIDLDVRLELARITGYALLRLEDATVGLRLEGGRLEVDEFEAGYESGRLSGRFALDSRAQPPAWGFALESFNIDVTTLYSQFMPSTDAAARQGTLDLSVDLRATGESPNELRGSLNGFFGAMLRDGTFLTSGSRALTLDVLRVSVPDFIPGRESRQELLCMLAVAPIEGGVATADTLYLAGKDITIVGEGSIDLGREKVDLTATPFPIDPSLLQIATTVTIVGPLDDPRIEPVRTSMVVSALRSVWKNVVRPARSTGEALRRLAGRPRKEAHDPCGEVAEQRVRQMKTKEIEAIDLESFVEDVIEELTPRR